MSDNYPSDVKLNENPNGTVSFATEVVATIAGPQDSVVASGHTIECRIYAEDPENNFMPAPGDITLYHEPKMRGVRIDSSIDRPTTISDSYDPMISKLICHGKDRESAIEITRNALKDYIVQTKKTNIPYLQSIIDNDDFIENKIDTSYCEKHQDELIDSMIKMRGHRQS